MSDIFTPDKLIAGTQVDIIGKSGTLKSGQGILLRGAVLGAIGRGLGAVGAVTGTGGGTISGVALGTKGKVGVYSIVCSATGAGAGTFTVTDPDGIRLADATVGVPYVSSQIHFTLNDGAPDFAVGDKFSVSGAAAADVGKFKLVDKAAMDGSGDPDADMVILAADTDTTADAVAPVYQAGEFNIAAVTFAAGTVAADYLLALQGKNIYLKDVYEQWNMAT
jgi:hypothetical protein